MNYDVRKISYSLLSGYVIWQNQHGYKKNMSKNLACVLIRFLKYYFYCGHFICHWPTCICDMFFLMYNDLVGVHLYLPLFLQCCCSPLQIQRTLNQRWRKMSPTHLCIQSPVTFLGLSEFIMTKTFFPCAGNHATLK